MIYHFDSVRFSCSLWLQLLVHSCCIACWVFFFSLTIYFWTESTIQYVDIRRSSGDRALKYQCYNRGLREQRSKSPVLFQLDYSCHLMKWNLHLKHLSMVLFWRRPRISNWKKKTNLPPSSYTRTCLTVNLKWKNQQVFSCSHINVIYQAQPDMGGAFHAPSSLFSAKRALLLGRPCWRPRTWREYWWVSIAWSNSIEIWEGEPTLGVR